MLTYEEFMAYGGLGGQELEGTSYFIGLGFGEADAANLGKIFASSSVSDAIVQAAKQCRRYSEGGALEGIEVRCLIAKAAVHGPGIVGTRRRRRSGAGTAVPDRRQ